MSRLVLFCEPSTFRTPDDAVCVTVDEEMYQAILGAPKLYQKSRQANAYVFGKLFGISTYKKIGYHYNDAAQTGFIDLDLVPTPVPNLHDDILAPIYLTKEFKKWDDRESLSAVRKLAPYVLFLGETAGGDVGADLYAHTTDGVVDSLIIDINYFFK